MKFETVGSFSGLKDLLILPENGQETDNIIAFLEKRGIIHGFAQADIKGQLWYGRTYIVAFFAEFFKSEIENLKGI